MSQYVSNIKDGYPQYLNDESNIVKNGSAERLYFPTNEKEIQNIISEASSLKKSLTISGGGTGISGGRVPINGWIIATDKMKSISQNETEEWKDPETQISYMVKLHDIENDRALLTVPIAMTLDSIQKYVRQKNWFYPPDPTERSSFIGGNVSTNASGARSFKYSATRSWIQSLRIVLASGEIVELDRNGSYGEVNEQEIIIKANQRIYSIPRPKFAIPNVTKHVAGPVITDNSHPLDLFIGSNGIFGFVTEVTIKLIRPPISIVSIFVYCESVEQAFKLIRICQKQRSQNSFPIPMSVEFFDIRSVDIMRVRDSRIKKDIKAIIMLEQDVLSEDRFDQAIEFWLNKFEKLGITDTDVAQTHSEIEHHKFLRHWVPEYVISLNRKFRQSLVVSDSSVPETVYKEYFDFLITKGEEFKSYLHTKNSLEDSNPGFTLFGHAGDCHPHLTLLPRNTEESEFALKLFLEILEKTVLLGGSIASEHGLGKKKYADKPALKIQYGEEGYNQVREMKIAIDPDFLLCPDNLILMSDK